MDIGLLRTVSTPFIYYPRSRPAAPLPPLLRITRRGFELTPEWRSYESSVPCKNGGGQDITTKLYIPSSRIFCVSQSIPFHLTLESSAYSLAAFLPYGPMANLMGKRPTRVQLMRQSTVDVRYAYSVWVIPRAGAYVNTLIQETR